MRTAAYVYTGWHPIAERDESFHPGFTEWELVRSCTKRFEGHAQPKVPMLGEYDDRDPVAFGKRISLGQARIRGRARSRLPRLPTRQHRAVRLHVGQPHAPPGAASEAPRRANHRSRANGSQRP